MAPHDASIDQRAALLSLYDASVHDVYAYLHRRCGSVALAEDLTAETFVAAVTAVQRGSVPSMSVAWLLAVARNKLVDHWRRQEREARVRLAAEADAGVDEAQDDWDAVLETGLTREVLAALGPHHRAALTLRYLDALPVGVVAAHLGRTVGATEVLLVRAKRAFRAEYERRTGEEER